MTRRLLAASCLGALLSSGALGANVYVLTSGDAATDSAVVAALTSRGHTVTVGVDYTTFDGTVNLTGFQTVYLQCNANWTAGVMPGAGQQQLIDWVNAGGRLVTGEWVIYYTYTGGGKFETLGSIIPAGATFSYGTMGSETFTVATSDATIDAGVPTSFMCNLTDYTGTETFASPKPGAASYFSIANSATATGLAGWAQGSGSVYSFTSTCGPDEVSDANFGTLFANVMGATGGGTCYANCDNSTTTPILNVNDFICFQTQFAAGNSYANCDHSTSAPVLNVNDFICFQTQFAAGCH